MVVIDVPKHMLDDSELNPPEYSEVAPAVNDLPPDFKYSEWSASGQGLRTAARVERDGRIGVSLDINEHLSDLPEDFAPVVDEFGIDHGNWRAVPSLSIVIMVVGSRGDVQPYIALAKRLKGDQHRVRIASHETFRTLVKESGLEFYDVGSNPRDLMAHIVTNPGLVPGIASLTNADVKKKRLMLAEMMKGCWNACHLPDQQTGIPFVADVIISNPQAFAHVHCAEALGIPLLMSSTTPWCATGAFAHPLVNVNSTNAGKRLTNYLSYALADTLIWQGIGDLVNKMRKSTLGLRSLSLRTGPDVLDRLKVPWTYLMSPTLIQKPLDWSNHIDVVGSYFPDPATSYVPSSDLARFLASGPAPVYIGFGSVVVDNPAEIMHIVFEATQNIGVRALVDWNGLGRFPTPPHVLLIGYVPHDWLFADNRVCAVVHHGGAGTTSIGLAKGRPTVVIPFFGDQLFWGDAVARTGAGPKPVAYGDLSVSRLADAIGYALRLESKRAAARIAERMSSENGVYAGVESFYRHLPLLNMRCDLDPNRLAVWWSTKHCMKLSAFAAQVLLDQNKIKLDHLDLHRPKEYDPYKKFTDPVTASVTSMFWILIMAPIGVAELFYAPRKGIIHTTTAVPKGVMKLCINLHEGMHNLPTLYGSEIRQQKSIRGVSDGFVEGGRGLAYGIYDGVTGLVTEPLRGAKENGIVGGLKGFARSVVNLGFKPTSGALGLIGLPAQGLYRKIRLLGSDNDEDARRVTRLRQGVEAVGASTQMQRRELLHLFEVADNKHRLEERRQAMITMAKQEVDQQIWMSQTESASRPVTDSPDDPHFNRDLQRALSLSQSVTDAISTISSNSHGINHPTRQAPRVSPSLGNATLGYQPAPSSLDFSVRSRSSEKSRTMMSAPLVESPIDTFDSDAAFLQTPITYADEEEVTFQHAMSLARQLSMSSSVESTKTASST